MDPQVMLGKRKLEDPSDPRAFKKRKIDNLVPTNVQPKSIESFQSKKKTTKKRRRKINLLACECCRQLHKKCDGTAPLPCSRCIKKKKKCVYKERKRRGPKSKKRTTSTTPLKPPVTIPNQMVNENSQQPQHHLSHQNHATHLQSQLQQLHQSELQPPQTQTISETIPMEYQWPAEYVELPPARPLSASSLQVSQTIPTTGTKASLQPFPFFPGHVLFLQHPPPPPPPQELQQESVSSSHPNQVQMIAEPWVGGWENF